VVLNNVGSCLPVDTAPRPKWLDSSARPLREPPISRLQFYFIFFHGLRLPLSAYIFSHTRCRMHFRTVNFPEYGRITKTCRKICQIKNRQSEHLLKKLLRCAGRTKVRTSNTSGGIRDLCYVVPPLSTF